MNYELLKKEFGSFGSFLVWDDSFCKNGIPKGLEDEEFRDKNLNNNFLYLAMNIRVDRKNFPEKQDSSKAFWTNKEILDDNLPDFFGFHGLEGGKYNTKTFTMFNNLITGTSLEGSYVTDFFKVSPKSKFPDGYATVNEDDVYDYINSLDEKQKAKFIGYQLKALDREVELLGNDKIKILVMSTIYEKIKSYFEIYVDKDKYPNLYHAKLIDNPPAFGEVLHKDIKKVIYVLMKNVSQKDYPYFLVGSIYRNKELIKNLIKIENKAEVLGVFYLSLNIDNKLDGKICEFLDKIKYKYSKEIKRVKSGFSSEIVREIIKNLGQISYEIDEDIDKDYKKYELFHTKVLESIEDEDVIIYENSKQKEFLNTIKVIEIQDKSFIVEDFYSFVMITLIKKALKLDGEIYYREYSKIKDKDYKMFFAKVNEDNIDKISNILTYDEIIYNKLLIDTKYFESYELKDFRNNILDFKNLYSLSIFDDKFMVVNMGIDSKDVEIEYLDKEFKFVYRDFIKKEFLKDKNISLELNPKNEEDISVKLKDISEMIAKGYPLTKLRFQGLKEYFIEDLENCKNYEDYIIYLENRHINKGFIDIQDSFIFEKDKKIEKYKIAKKGDLIISKNPPYYLVIIEDDLNYVVIENLFLIKVIKDKINPYYILAAIQSIISLDINKIRNKNHITISSLRNLDIKMYSNNKRKDIVNKTKNTMEEIKKLTKSLNALIIKRDKIFTD